MRLKQKHVAITKSLQRYYITMFELAFGFQKPH